MTETLLIKCQKCKGTGLTLKHGLKTVGYVCEQCRGAGCEVLHFEIFLGRKRRKGVRFINSMDKRLNSVKISAKEFYARKIVIRNLGRCKVCGDEIESKSVHDFVSCSCGAVSVDGGREYLKRSGDPTNFEERSKYV